MIPKTILHTVKGLKGNFRQPWHQGSLSIFILSNKQLQWKPIHYKWRAGQLPFQKWECIMKLSLLDKEGCKWARMTVKLADLFQNTAFNLK